MLDLKAFVDAQAEANVDVAITDLANLYMKYQEEHGIRPQAMIGGDGKITKLIINLYGGEPNWREPVFLQIHPDDPDSIVRVFRTVDVQTNTIYLI